MKPAFYDSQSYRLKQSLITKTNWRKGTYDFLLKKDAKKCQREGCQKRFLVTQSDPKKFCSRSCAAKVNNSKRILSTFTKLKISNSLKGKPNPSKGVEKVARLLITCNNPKCKKKFKSLPWEDRKYCSMDCAITHIGSKTTSPKAARGKSGIRGDINPKICFYSRWEANVARILNYLNIRWEFGTKSFDLKRQNYRPDFYLPDYNFHIEVKNFLGDYSRNRTNLFKKFYPNENLGLILKDDYRKLEEIYSKIITNWEFDSHSKPGWWSS